MLKEFKEFALKGNLVDLAVGFIIGVAFSGLVQSLVNDIIMPIIGWITGGVDFSNLYIQLAGAPAATLDEARKAGATLAYGNFITLVINFLIIASVLFLIIKAMNCMKRPAAPAPAVPPPRQEVLLEEIRNSWRRRARPRTRWLARRCDRTFQHHVLRPCDSKHERSSVMAMLKVIEVLAELKKSWEDAAQQAVTTAAKTVRGIKSINVKNFQATVDKDKIISYRLNAKITFALEG